MKPKQYPLCDPLTHSPTVANASLVYHNYLNDPYVLQLDNLFEGHYSWPGIPYIFYTFEEYDLSFQQYLASTNHTKVNWNTQRYGYGWGFRGTPILLATAVLLAQALTALVHTVVTVLGGWTSDAWGTMGEMLVLALDSTPMERSWKCVSAGSEVWRGRNLWSWKDVVKVGKKDRDSPLELTSGIGEDSELEGMSGVKKLKRRNAWRI